MRITVLFTLLAALSATAWAQQPAASTKTIVSASDVAAMIAKAKSTRKPDQANFTQPIVQNAPYSANLEYRVAEVNANPSVHEREAEMMYVVDGSANIILGGKLHDEKRTNAANLTGTAIDGGTSRHIGKGDFIMVPENTAHGFSGIDGVLVLMTIHLPHIDATPSAR